MAKLFMEQLAMIIFLDFIAIMFLLEAKEWM
ncbi:Uncharacterised protein [Actinobacillus ureae]|nr:Uncharacterised protein [Actinobacillus ureae]SUU43044.1 Uncharacterised protein [Actinobacillus ureae]